MPVTVTADLYQDLELREENGVYVYLKRRYLVQGLTASAGSVATTFDEALDASGVPVRGDSPSGFTGLVVTRRTVTGVPDSPSKAYVDVEYQALGRGGIVNYQDTVSFEGGTSLQQVSSQNDFFGSQITVQHTFPATDADFPGSTITQGGQIDVLAPHTTVRATYQAFTNFPDVVARQWTGFVNSTYWAGDPPGTWLCANVTFTPANVVSSPAKWDFTFEFQYDGTGWQPSVIFQDARDGKPPPNLVAGVGYKTVTWYPSRNFNFLFPV